MSLSTLTSSYLLGRDLVAGLSVDGVQVGGNGLTALLESAVIGTGVHAVAGLLVKGCE